MGLTTAKAGLPVYLDDPRGVKGKLLVGRLWLSPKGRLFKKWVKRSRHYMDVVKGYGIDKSVFDKHLRGRKGRVMIIETDTGRVLVASIKTWTDHSSAANYGDAKQIFLSEKYMHGSELFEEH